MLDFSIVSTVLVFLVTLLLIWLASTIYQRQSYPPGPFPLPVFGNLLTVRGKSPINVIEWFNDMAQQYGSLASFQLGSMKIVIINDVKTMQEAFVKKSADFSNRPTEALPFVKIVTKHLGTGVILTNGVPWSELRRTSLTSMREFGVGKKSLEEKVMEEVAIILNKLADTNEEPYFVKPILMKATANVISNVIFGARFDHNDEKFEKLLYHLDQAFRVSPLFQPVNFFPFLQNFPMFMKGPKHLIQSLTTTSGYIKELMAEHETTFDPDNIRDFVDLLIDLRKNNMGEKHFTEENLRRVIVDLFTAGSETTSTALYWGMVYMAAYPDVQRKCQEEVDSVVGRSRQLTVADKAQMKYTEATIMEILRMGIITPLAVPHCTSRDTTVKGYMIPKETIIFANLGLMARDPDMFPEPYKFKPERFMDDKGNVVHKDRLVSFGVGPRSCLGEILAKMELNLFFPSIMQFYTVSPVSDKQPVDLQQVLGLTLQPKIQDLVFKRR